MNKKEIGRLAASAVVCAIGTITGLAMMVFFGKKIDEDNKENIK